MLEVELAGGCKKTKPLTDDEIFDIVLEKVRVTSPRINTTHLNSKGTKEELTTDRIADLLQIQEPEVGLSAKRTREEVGVNFTGGFSGHSYDQEQDFGGNKEGKIFQWRRQQHTMEEAKVPLRQRRQAGKGQARQG
jgi:hypothetical protein